MSELRNPTLLSPGSRIVVSCSVELGRFFERTLDGLVGIVPSGLFVWCLYPRNAFKLQHILDALWYDEKWMMVESARGESLMVCRCLDLVVNRESSLFIGLEW